MWGVDYYQRRMFEIHFFFPYRWRAKWKKSIKLAVDNNCYAIGVFAFAGPNYFFSFIITIIEGNKEPNFQRNVKVSKLLGSAFKTIVWKIKLNKNNLMLVLGIRIPHISHTQLQLFLEMQFIKFQMHQSH